MSCLCILETNPLSVTLFANIFSQSIGCYIFVLFMVSFAVQKLLSLLNSNYVYFCFYFCYSSRLIKNNLIVIYVRLCSAYIFL